MNPRLKGYYKAASVLMLWYFRDSLDHTNERKASGTRNTMIQLLLQAQTYYTVSRYMEDPVEHSFLLTSESFHRDYMVLVGRAVAGVHRWEETRRRLSREDLDAANDFEPYELSKCPLRALEVFLAPAAMAFEIELKGV